MIGDEVMFTVDAPVAAAEIGLALAEGTRGADELSDVRVGMAYGPLLEREGDLYGSVVNLASRITAIAFPGSIVVGPSLRDELADHDAYRLRSMRPRSLKDIGRVPLWVLRRAAPAESRFAERRRAAARVGEGAGRTELTGLGPATSVRGAGRRHVSGPGGRRSELVDEQGRLLEGREVAAPVELVPVADVGEPPRGPAAGRPGHLLREDRASRGHVDRPGGRHR